MNSPLEPLAEEGRPCIYCRGGFAEPEQDGDVVYFACPECAGEFGHHKAGRGTFCAAGLPVDIRADPAQPPGVVTIDTGAEQRKVFLGVTITRRPE